MKIIPVTCAIIFQGNKVLCTQRSETMPLPLKWEFPGGKLEPDEDDEACLIREIKEELEIDIEIIEKLTPVIHHYNHIFIKLIPFKARISKGQINLIEHKNFEFVKVQDLLKFDWADADLPIVLEIIAFDR